MVVKEHSFDNLKKGIVLVFIANVINLLISLITGFILPKYLSVGTYANIKTYQLYANYIGILVLGYSDGLYLLYGGKQLSEVGNKSINIFRTNLLLFQGLMTVLVVLLSFVTGNTILLITAASVIPINIVATYKCVFQATGEFRTYSKILNYTSVLTLAGSMFLLFIVKTDNSFLYIIWNVAVSFLIWILMEIKMVMEYHNKIYFSFNLKNLIDNIKAGIILMLGNFSSILITSIDRWFVKVLLTVKDFAFYSFIVSVENLMAVFIMPIVTTMYNYICTVTSLESIKKIKKMCLLFSVFLISMAFPVKFILEVYLTKYLGTKYILFILFATEIFYILIKGIYVNIYKARKQQSEYLKQLIVVIIIGTALNAIAYFIHHSNEAIAFATLLSVIIWYTMCCVSVKEIAPDWKENLLLALVIPIYMICGFFFSAIYGFIIYIFLVFLLSLLLMKDSLIEITNIGINMIKKKTGVKE